MQDCPPRVSLLFEWHNQRAQPAVVAQARFATQYYSTRSTSFSTAPRCPCSGAFRYHVTASAMFFSTPGSRIT